MGGFWKEVAEMAFGDGAEEEAVYAYDNGCKISIVSMLKCQRDRDLLVQCTGYLCSKRR